MPEIEINEAALEHLRNQGGKLYLWVDAHGLLHHRLNDPRSLDEDWLVVHVGELREIAIHIAPSAVAAKRWEITMHHLPWRWLEVTCDLIHSGAQGPTH